MSLVQWTPLDCPMDIMSFGEDVQWTSSCSLGPMDNIGLSNGNVHRIQWCPMDPFTWIQWTTSCPMNHAQWTHIQKAARLWEYLGGNTFWKIRGNFKLKVESKQEFYKTSMRKSTIFLFGPVRREERKSWDLLPACLNLIKLFII